MKSLTLEHSKSAYRLDMGVLAGTSVAVVALLIVASPRARLVQIIAFAALGLAGWTIIEYGLHRFVLHGLRPFSTWHAQHHRRPTARIYSPAALSISLILALAFCPAWPLWGPWPAVALTFGLLAGDLSYAITHHVLHNCRAESNWTRRRKRWHALHHRQRRNPSLRPGYYGVTSAFWDHAFGTAHG